MRGDQTSEEPTTNIERLRGHLQENTLAAKLVDAYRANSPDERSVALRDVAEARLAEIREALSKEATSNGTD